MISAKELKMPTNKELQLKINFKDDEITIRYKKTLLDSLEIKEEDFNTISEKLQKIINFDNLEESCNEIASLFIVNTKLFNDGDEGYEVRQELKTVSNRKCFTLEENQKINAIILIDIFEKMKIPKETIEAQFGKY